MIADFANGEISQASCLFQCDVTLENYMARRLTPPWPELRRRLCGTLRRSAPRLKE